MKIFKSKNLFRALGLGVAAAIPLLSSAPALAASATESLVQSGSAYKGSNFQVYLKINSGAEPVNTATAVISYPTDKLSYLSVSNSSAYSIAAATSGGGGTVRIDRGAFPAVSGVQTVAIINFRALTDTGTASLAITSGTAYSANSNANIYAGGSGLAVAMKAAPVATPAAPAPPADTIPPKITGLSVTAVTAAGATINWTTSEPATSEVDYGPTQGYGLSTSDGQLVTDHKITVNSPLISPATLYHVIVKSADAANNITSSADTTFTTKGASLLAKVVNKSNKKVVGAKVTFGDQSGVTDKNGSVTLTGLPLGKQTGTVEFRGKTTAVKIDLAAAALNKAQAYTFKIDAPSSMAWLIWLVLILALAGLAYVKRAALPGLVTTAKAKFAFKNGSGPKPPSTPSTPAGPAAPSGPSIIHPSK